MQFTKLTVDQLEKAAIMLKAMAHPLRIAIMNLLDDSDNLTVTEIHEQLNIEQSTASHHLGILKDKGILSSKREGKNTRYSLRHENLKGIVDCINKCACE